MDDDELRERLRRADPTSAMGPADPARVTRRLEATMSDPHTPDPRPGTRVLLVVAAAAVVLVAAVGFVLGHRGSDPAPVAMPPAPSSVPTSVPTDPAATGTPKADVDSLRVAAVAARCAPPSAAVLGRQPVAFAGTVVSLDGGRAVLEVSRVYAGDVADRVRVAAPDADLQQLLAAVDFTAGRRYLVSADAGQVTVCGYSGPASPALTALYDQAFGR